MTPRYSIAPSLAAPYALWMLVDHDRETSHNLKARTRDEARAEAISQMEIPEEEIAP